MNELNEETGDELDFPDDGQEQEPEFQIEPGEQDPQEDETGAEDGDEEPEESEQEQEVDAEQDQGEEPEDDLADVSKSVRSRIERERRVKQQERDRADKAESEALRLEEANVQLRRALLELSSNGIDREIALSLQQLKKAKDDGNTDEDVRLTGEIADLRAKRMNLSQFNAEIERDAAKVEAKKSAPKPRANPLAEEWASRNKWFMNPRNEEQRSIAISIDAALQKQGYRPNTREFYKELDIRLRKRIPEVYQNKPKPKSPVTTSSSVARPTTSAKRGAVTLKQSDLRMMQEAGYDIESKEVQQMLAQSKRKYGGA